MLNWKGQGKEEANDTVRLKNSIGKKNADKNTQQKKNAILQE